MGPEALKLVSVSAESQLFNKYAIEEVPNRNEVLLQPTTTKHALRIEHICATWVEQAQAVERAFANGDTPVVISADHASAGGTIAGIRRANPGKRLGVIWVDAHADLHSPYTTPSGNVHGMPLAASLGFDNTEKQRNEPGYEAKGYWTQMKELGAPGAGFSATDLVFVGVRDTEEQEEFLMEEHDIRNHPVSDVNSMGAASLGQQILDDLKDCDLIYVSFDVDSMDPDAVSYGTGTPVKDGLTPEQATDLLTTLVTDKRVCCFEMVEVNPLLDNKGNEMAETAFGILEKVVETMEKR